MNIVGSLGGKFQRSVRSGMKNYHNIQRDQTNGNPMCWACKGHHAVSSFSATETFAESRSSLFNLCCLMCVDTRAAVKYALLVEACWSPCVQGFTMFVWESAKQKSDRQDLTLNGVYSESRDLWGKWSNGFEVLQPFVPVNAWNYMQSKEVCSPLDTVIYTTTRSSYPGEKNVPFMF